jgi:hydroxymethylpyrimidine/phosphomethylpyrimidine kinase
MAKGKSVPDAVHTAKEFIREAIGNPLAIGSGRGPVNHWAYRRTLSATGEV